MKDDGGEGHIGGATCETNLGCQAGTIDEGTNAGSLPLSAKTALMLAILDMRVAIVPTNPLVRYKEFMY
jgi:hypothetical protein